MNEIRNAMVLQAIDHVKSTDAPLNMAAVAAALPKDFLLDAEDWANAGMPPEIAVEDKPPTLMELKRQLSEFSLCFERGSPSRSLHDTRSVRHSRNG